MSRSRVIVGARMAKTCCWRLARSGATAAAATTARGRFMGSHHVTATVGVVGGRRVLVSRELREVVSATRLDTGGRSVAAPASGEAQHGAPQTLRRGRRLAGVRRLRR